MVVINRCESVERMCGFIAQLVEHRTGIAVTGSNPVEAQVAQTLWTPSTRHCVIALLQEFVWEYNGRTEKASRFYYFIHTTRKGKLILLFFPLDG